MRYCILDTVNSGPKGRAIIAQGAALGMRGSAQSESPNGAR